MIISIEDHLVELKRKLIELGYEVYNFSDKIPSEAYIYSEKVTGLHSLNNSIIPDAKGSLLVDADGKSLNDIDYILSHRVYTPLFNITSIPKDYVW